MGRTLTQLIQGVGRRLSSRSRYIAAHGTGAAGTYTSTKLKDMPDDWYNGMWFYHAADVLEDRVTNFVGTTGALTLASGTTYGSSSDFELLPVRPSDITEAINDAAQQLADVITRTRVDNSYVTNSPLFNAGFEDTTGAALITGWQASTATMAREAGAANKLSGAYSAKVSGSAGYIEPTTEFQLMLHDLRGAAITVYCHAKCDTASDARLRLVIDGTTTNGSYHTGGSGWETLEVTATVPDPVDTFTVRLMHDAGAGTTYWDNGWIEGGPTLYVYRLPANLERGPGIIRITDIGDRDTLLQHRHGRLWTGWQFLREEDEAVTTTRNTLHILRPPSFGRWLMLGWEPLNVLSARADVAEISEEAAELLEVRAALLIASWLHTTDMKLRQADLARQEAELRYRLPETLKVASL